MAQRSNPPRHVRRKVSHNYYYSSSRSTTQGSEDEEVQLRPSSNEQQRAPAKKLLICLDYGTAFTSISYLPYDLDKPPVDISPSSIRCIRNWPHARGPFHAGSPSVPSKSLYRNGVFLWGHSVQNKLQALSVLDGVSSLDRTVQLPKLLLDDDGDGSEEDPLLPQKEVLRNVGKTAREAVQDYLMRVFKHAHPQLEKQEGFNETWVVELVLCVPSKWSTYAQLTMQEIMLEVVKETGMRGRDFSMFIIEEPEAAVTFALGQENIREFLEKNPTFIVCDAGGGTVDAITYSVRQTKPFRFDEIATPAGKDCGSSYIDQALIQDCRRRLAHITEIGCEPLFSKEAIMQDNLFRTFEQELKRYYDPEDWDKEECRGLRMVGLRPDSARNFGNGFLFITKDQMNAYFKRSLEGTRSLILEQLEQLDGIRVQALLLVGGFSRSPALQRSISEAFKGTYLNVLRLDDDIDITTAVSRGGVLRALNKEDGPRRKLRLNLGVCLTEPWNPKYAGHRNAPWFRHPLNNKKYVKDCMDWVIRKDRVLGQRESAEIRLHRVFAPDEEMYAYETIYFSDQRVFQHYRLDDPRNSGHRKAGVVEASLESLRDNNMLEEKVNDEGKKYYEVDYSMKLEVNGRNVKATIHCPPGQDVQGEAQICIAAAFRPGTN
ncbi:hypothetical protein BDW67DRAFT_181481 [Aspergillus spinulosporus]